ncbi:hypothetical protein T4D_15596 [Trichinella pseudospiralis]|uniref:Uncharacterized protein n=1 Tax=Trichinella pseudospiralis TaxID=6337 RepID=A0A0V1F5L1_TRIPS|nr:hypothetical protein T4D_15596 [Trichinella pseudospiralis]
MVLGTNNFIPTLGGLLKCKHLVPTGNSLFHISLINVSYRIRGKVDRDMITLLMNISILSRMIIPYSAMNRRANSTLENSMLKPLTSSLSASAKSKGLRSVLLRQTSYEMLWLMDRSDP